jgi:hypothetical protein
MGRSQTLPNVSESVELPPSTVSTVKNSADGIKLSVPLAIVSAVARERDLKHNSFKINKIQSNTTICQTVFDFILLCLIVYAQRVGTHQMKHVIKWNTSNGTRHQMEHIELNTSNETHNQMEHIK